LTASGSKIGRQEPGSSSCSGLESESPNSSHSGSDSAGSASVVVAEEGMSLRSSCERMRTNGPARRDGGRREKIRRERVRLYFCISIWMPRETKGCFFFFKLKYV